MNIDPKGLQIIAQTATKIGAELLASPNTEFTSLLDASAEAQEVILALVGGAVPKAQPAPQAPAQEAVDNVVQAFPGATEVPPAAAPVAPAPVAQPAPQAAAPTGIGPLSSEEDLWADLIANFGNWWDNRASKKSDKHPDFRHKTVEKDGYKLGLWLTSKSLPAFAAEAFGVAAPVG